MPGVTINGGAGSGAHLTMTAGTNTDVANQAASIIGSALSSAAASQTTITTENTVPSAPAGTVGYLVVSPTNGKNVVADSTYQYFTVTDVQAPVTVTGGGAANQVAILGTNPGGTTVVFNTGGGSGTVVGGDGNKSINASTAIGFAVYTGGGNDTISVGAGRNTVAAGAGQNSITLGTGTTQIRSTGNDTVQVGAGNATIQAAGSNQDSVVGGSGAMTIINGSGSANVNFSTQTTAPLSSGSATAFGGAGGGYYRGGSNGNNLLIGGAGAVTLQGAGNGDVLIATGTSATQVLQAGAGNETLLGSLSSTNNYFVGGPGNDLIIAGSGNDTVFAGSGSETITGGAGADTFIFSPTRSAGASITLTDFTPGVDHVTLNYGNSGLAASAAASARSVGATSSHITLSDGTSITFQGITTVRTSFFS